MNELNILQMCNHIPPKYILNYNLNGLNAKYH